MEIKRIIIYMNFILLYFSINITSSFGVYVMRLGVGLLFI